MPSNGINARAIDNLGLSLHREGKEWVVRNREGQLVIATTGIRTELKRRAGIPLAGRQPTSKPQPIGVRQDEHPSAPLTQEVIGK
jgi:flavin-dependent dehydrogenase